MRSLKVALCAGVLVLSAAVGSQSTLLELRVKRPTMRVGGLVLCGGEVVDKEMHLSQALVNCNDKASRTLLR